MISFEPKEKEKPTTKKDMGISSNNKGLVYNLIIDGEIVKQNLEHANKTEKWLKQNNVEYDKLIIESQDKAEKCIQNNVNIFIDDRTI